jgi:transposase
MSLIFYVGIDVSKKELDYSVIRNNKEFLHFKSTNDLKGIRSFIAMLKKHEEFSFKTTLFCMEYTGIYNNKLLDYLLKENAYICLEPAIQIKKSGGILRGKNDKIDACRIAMYAYKNREELRLWKPKREIIDQLKLLTTVRSRLLNTKKQLIVPLNESEAFIKKDYVKISVLICKTSIKALEKDIEKADKAIQELIDSDIDLKRLHKIITSVKGIGTVTATEIIICTNEFKDIKDPRKFACYAGVAPFEHSSGSSIKGRTRVSKMANKSMKTLLHLAAMSAIQYCKDIRIYYDRKVREGKNKMSIINAVRNKLILRVFACVRQNRLYISIP